MLFLILTCDIFKIRVAQNSAHYFKYVMNNFREPPALEFKINPSTSLFKESVFRRLSGLACSICNPLDVSLVGFAGLGSFL